MNLKNGFGWPEKITMGILSICFLLPFSHVLYDMSNNGSSLNIFKFGNIKFDRDEFKEFVIIVYIMGVAGYFMMVISFGTMINLHKMHEGLKKAYKKSQEDVEEIKNKDEYLSLIKHAVDAASDGIAITDEGYNIIFINHSYLKKIGHKSSNTDNLIGVGIRDLYHENEREFISEVIMPTVQIKKGWEGTIEIASNDGGRFTGDISFTKLPGNLILNVVRDATERVKNEKDKKEMLDQKFQSQKSEAITRMAESIVHNFDDKITNIQNFLEVFMATQDKKHYDLLLLEVHETQDLVNQLLSLTGYKNTNISAFDVGLVVKEVEEVIFKEATPNISFAANVVLGKYFTNANQDMKKRVIYSLCRNAIEAIGNKDGLVTVTLTEMNLKLLGIEEFLLLDTVTDRHKSTFIRQKLDHDKSILMAGYLQHEKKYLQLTVSDTGNGIPPEILQNIFDPFFTTKIDEKGLGIGLSTIHAVVTGKGGAIVVETAVGAGTKVHIFIPHYEPVAEPLPLAASA